MTDLKAMFIVKYFTAFIMIMIWTKVTPTLEFSLVTARALELGLWCCKTGCLIRSEALLQKIISLFLSLERAHFTEPDKTTPFCGGGLCVTLRLSKFGYASLAYISYVWDGLQLGKWNQYWKTGSRSTGKQKKITQLDMAYPAKLLAFGKRNIMGGK